MERSCTWCNLEPCTNIYHKVFVWELCFEIVDCP